MYQYSIFVNVMYVLVLETIHVAIKDWRTRGLRHSEDDLVSYRKPEIMITLLVYANG